MQLQLLQNVPLKVLLSIQSSHGILVRPNTKKLSDIEKTEKQLQKAAKKQKQKTGSETRETSTVSLNSKNASSRSSTGLPGTDKDTRKMNAASDRLKKPAQRLQISNSYQTLRQRYGLY